jgi:uncharacterized protein with HEPN domain
LNKETSAFLGHILKSIDLIERYTNGRTESDFLASVELQDQVIHRIEIIGEYEFMASPVVLGRKRSQFEGLDAIHY